MQLRLKVQREALRPLRLYDRYVLVSYPVLVSSQIVVSNLRGVVQGYSHPGE